MKIDEIPYGYAYCYAVSGQCSNREHCLRSHAARLNEEMPAEPKEIAFCITPTYVVRVAGGETCRYFRSDKPLRYARGMKKLFDVVPRKDFSSIRNEVIYCFSCKRIFYYAQRGEQLISPTQQQEIAEIFERAGLPAPIFDRYEDSLDWTR